MSASPFFTVGIPVYNTAKWVGHCIESVLSQDFDDFELILLNDGSKDNSLDILNEYAAKDARIKVVDRPNMGISAGRNTIFSLARGQYIFTVDSDDEMCENVLSKAYNRIVETDYPDILQTGLIKNENGKISYEVPEKDNDNTLKELWKTKDERAVVIWTKGFFMPPLATKFIKRDYLHKYGIGNNILYVAGEDSDFCLQLLRTADSIAYDDFCSSVYYRPREGSRTTVLSYRVIRDKIKAWNNIFDNFEFWNLSDEILKLAHSNNGYLYVNRSHIITSFSTNKSKEEAFKTVNMINSLIGDKIRKLPVGNVSVQEKIIFTLIKIAGIPFTSRLLYLYYLIVKKLRK